MRTPSSFFLLFPFVVTLMLAQAGCRVDVMPMRGDAGRDPFVDGGFACTFPEAEACSGTTHYWCVPDGEFLRAESENCATRTDERTVCIDDIWCAVCRPEMLGCYRGDSAQCNADGLGWTVIDDCDIEMGEACIDGMCVNLCEEAIADSTYAGCEFYAADLDNASLGAGYDASAQPYAIVVSNPGTVPTEVVIELDRAAFGAGDDVEIIDSVIVAAGDLEVFELPRREVDGASSMAPCAADAECSAPDTCLCRGGGGPGPGADDCRCRVSADTTGFNDGTHSALTSRAYRVRSQLPVIAYQFNPLDNVSVFSNDASLLMPTAGIGSYYTVNGWPQTIADSLSPSEDFDPSRTDEDLRASLTVIGTTVGTHLTVTLGSRVREVVGVGAFPGPLAPGAILEFDLGPFDVVNLETHGFNADFTGTIVESTAGVSVFSGSEASDVPRFSDLATRRCCADHLEEQLLPDRALGAEYYIGRTNARAPAVNAAFLTADSVGEFPESEWVRILAVDVGPSGGPTTVTTTLPPPYNYLELDRGEDIIVEATQDFHIVSDGRISVIQLIASQQAVGIPSEYPGGDPAMIVVPPVGQWRSEYVFLTPGFYAFDFITIVAPAEAAILLDGEPLDPLECSASAADGLLRNPGDAPPTHLAYRCQLSFPDLIGPAPLIRVEDGNQDDGYHTIQATAPVSIVVTGFDAYVSYAYAGGMNLDSIE